MFFTNQELAAALEKFADELELQDDNPYRIRAYRRAAGSLRRFKLDIAQLVNDNEDLTVIPNVGTRIAFILKEMIITGNLPFLPQRKIAPLAPAKYINKKRKSPQFKIYLIMPFIEKILLDLKTMPEIKQIECAGDYRRKKEVIGDIDILIETDDIKKVFEKFHQFYGIKYIIKIEEHLTTVQLKFGIYLTLHKVDKEQFSAKLLELTGSSEHYATLQILAREKNYELRSDGLFKKKTQLRNNSEAIIYQNLDLNFIPPELRENRGEIQAAAENKLPKLIELKDIKGDLHCHTNETDGTYTLEEMVEAARTHGYAYVAITDHSQSLKITNGMNEKRLLQQIDQIDRLNATFKDFVILKSMEVDILEDGRLDLSNEVLKKLDITVCSVHSKFKLPNEKQTERIIRAMDNPYFNILGHATGRLISHRPPYQIDIDRIFQAAKERNCFIELNAQPARLDINDIYCKKAKELGVKIAISSDAHSVRGFSFMILGINQARRGWLEASDVINTYELSQLRKLIKRI